MIENPLKIEKSSSGYWLVSIANTNPPIYLYQGKYETPEQMVEAVMKTLEEKVFEEKR